MSQMTKNNFSIEDFNQVVVLFAWLKTVRDQLATRVDDIEPLNELNSCVDEVQNDLEKNL